MDEHKLEASSHEVEFASIESEELREFAALQQIFASDERRKQLLRKLDWRLIPPLAMCYLLAWIDRGNMGNGRVFGLEKDLNLTSAEYNYCLMVFFFSYAAIEIPGALAMKRFGPAVVLPIIMLSFGIVTVASGFTQNFGGLITCRFFLGAAEGYLFPATGLILSLWYTGAELQKRIAGFYCSAAAAGAFSGLLAYAIANLDHVLGHRAWRWIFWIEGSFTVLFGILSIFIILDVPEKTGKWLTDEERRYLVLRKRYEHGAVPVGNQAGARYLKQALLDWKVYAASLWYFSNAVANYGLTYTMPTILVSFGYSAARAQAMTAPPFVFACLATVGVSFLADRTQRRAIWIFWSYLIVSAAYIIIIVTARHPHLSGVTYGAIFFAAAGLYMAAPCYVAFLGINIHGQVKRANGLAIQTLIGTLGGAVGSNIYLTEQKPEYPLGFGLSMGVIVAAGLVALVTHVSMLHINKKRDKMDPGAIHQRYTSEELSELGDKSPLFRYSP
ncbi:hypothetical protein JCM10207_004394 [Rhodosporidiobolus poonsookiae]